VSDAVPNLQPSADPGAVRLAVVAKCPGEAEQTWRICNHGHGYAGWRWVRGKHEPAFRCWCGSSAFTPAPQPLCGPAGELLTALLKDNGLRREQVFLGNVSRVPLTADERTLDNLSVQSGLARLALDLETFKPHCVLAMGGLALQAFLENATAKISRWRGSIVACTLAGVQYKVVFANNPAHVLRMPADLCLMRRDVARACEEARTPELRLPQRRMAIQPTFDFAMIQLEMMSAEPTTAGFDIEGGCDVGVTVLSFALSPDLVFSIPFRRLDFSLVWSKEQEAALWNALRSVLEDPRIPKVMHNAAFEMFVFARLHGIRIRNVEDTMLMWHALYCELDKGLDVLASVLTREPHWGVAGEWATDEERDRYNAIDSAVTLECWQAMSPLLSADQRRYYQFQLWLLEPVLDMQLRGVPVDCGMRDALGEQLQREALAAQGELDTLAGIPAPSFDDVADAVVHKNHRAKVRDWPDVIAYAKPSFKETL
jgi:uracil-DNA glycosylase family 4